MVKDTRGYRDRREYKRQYWRDHYKGLPPRDRRDEHLKQRYKISLEDYQSLVENQGGLCLICEKPNPKLVVDHDHATGLIRGLVCPSCNHGLHYVDKEGFWEAALQYLENHARIQSNRL